MEAPEYLIGDYYGDGEVQFSPENTKSSDYLAVDEYLLDFSNEEHVEMAIDFLDCSAGNSSDSSTVTGNAASRSFSETQFSHELSIPYDDLAELEWLSNFVEESFSTEEKDPHDLSSLSGAGTSSHLSDARNSRATHCDMSTRLPSNKSQTSNSESLNRKCFHCAAEKTPQWRAGPMGPKTLCNACGVRYKSGRLVPEYRPASSPTFAATKHSNSHRKVLELRRQKEEIQRGRQQQFLSQSSIFCAANGCDEFLICHQNGHDFNRLI